MKLLVELLEHIDHDKARAVKHRVWALKAQQAIAENDGWTSELSAPKPMDEETGEVFNWTGLATHEPDMNALAYAVQVFDHDTHTEATLSFRHDGWPRKGMFIDLTKPLDVCAQKFADSYKELLDDVVVDQSDELQLALHDIDWNGDADDFRSDAEDILDDHLIKWMEDYKQLSHGVVNSRDLANALADRIKADWDAEIDSRIEQLIDMDDGRNPTQRRTNNRWGGRE